MYFRTIFSCAKQGGFHMKLVIRVLAGTFCFLLGVISVFGQDYTISASEYPKLGTSSVMETDTTSHAAVNIGTGGKNQTWTFTQTLVGRTIHNNTTAAGAAYMGASFPTAGWAIQGSQYLDISAYPPLLVNPMVGFFETNFFERVISDTVYGMGMSIKTPLYSGGGPFVKLALNFPLPLTVGKKWLRDSQFNFPVSIIYFGMPITTTVALNDSAWVEVDATGKLTIPLGTFDCVRLKSKRTLTLMFLLGAQWNTLERRAMTAYQWYTKNAGLLLEVTSHPGETNDNFPEAALIVRMQSSSAVTGIDCGPDCGAEAALPSGCTMRQNYPNPFNPSTRIPYTLQMPATVDIRVCDLLGKEVVVLETGFKQAGSYETLWNGRDWNGAVCPGAMYFCKMKAVPVNGSQPVVQTRKMLLTD
jgi:hypothetical protein